MDPLLIVILSIVGLAVVLPALFVAVIYGVIPAARFCGWMGRHIGLFLKAMAVDTGRAIGHVVMCFAFSGLVVYNLLLKREKATEHFAMAFEREAMSAGVCMYRLVLGNPLRLLYLHGLIEGLERRLPQVVAQAPVDEDGTTGGFGAESIAGARGDGQGAEGAANGTLAGEASGVAGGAAGGGEAGVNETSPVGRRDGGDTGGEERGEATQAAALPRRRHTPKYEGYEILGTLAGGGSGGRLYVARPTPEIEAELAGGRTEAAKIGDVEIKSFSIREGSSLPQIIRESRSLEAAHRLGLILDHDLTSERFYYVMRYVPGDCLSVVVQDLHAGGDAGVATSVVGATGGAGAAGGAGGAGGAGVGTCSGLDAAGLRRAVEHTADLVATLRDYHEAGLWHKDIKPDNIIIHKEDGRARLVDFGLLTPLRSSMTLTTHGTEYFRDPEMVRLALRGVKVRDVDGCRFDIYGAGAVLYSLVENSFPAHGALSSIGKRCPDAIKWIVRRAMTDYDKRYPTATAMLDDLLAVIDAMDAGNLEALRPMDLPSVRSAGFADAYADWVDGGKVGPEPVALEHPSGRARAWAAPVALAGTFTGRRSDRRPAAPADPEAVARNADGQIDLLLAQAADRRAAAQGEGGLAEGGGVEEFVPTGEITGVATADGTGATAEGGTGAGGRAASGGKNGEPTTAEAGKADTGAAVPEDDFEVTMRPTEEVVPVRRRQSAGAEVGSGATAGSAAGSARVRANGARPAELRPGDTSASASKRRWSSRVRFSVVTFVVLTVVVLRLVSGPSSDSGSKSVKPIAKGQGGESSVAPEGTGETAGGGGGGGLPTSTPTAPTSPGKPVKPAPRNGRKPADEPAASGQSAGLGINIDELSIDLYNLPATLLKAAVSVVTAAPTEEDATAIRSFMKKGPVAVSLAQLNVKSRLLILTDPEVLESSALSNTLELIDLAMWSASIGPIKQNLGQDAIMPNLEGTLAAVSEARFGNKDDAIRVREAMKELPGSPFCSGFLWLTKDSKEAGKLRAWLVLQPDTNPTVAVKIIQSLRVVLRGDLSKK